MCNAYLVDEDLFFVLRMECHDVQDRKISNGALTGWLRTDCGAWSPDCNLKVSTIGR